MDLGKEFDPGLGPKVTMLGQDQNTKWGMCSKGLP